VLWLGLVTVLFFAPAGLVISELGTAFPHESGPYVWARMAFGRLDGVAGGAHLPGRDAGLNRQLARKNRDRGGRRADRARRGRVAARVRVRDLRRDSAFASLGRRGERRAAEVAMA
jgi:hypothetical protein